MKTFRCLFLLLLNNEFSIIKRNFSEKKTILNENNWFVYDPTTTTTGYCKPSSIAPVPISIFIALNKFRICIWLTSINIFFVFSASKQRSQFCVNLDGFLQMFIFTETLKTPKTWKHLNFLLLFDPFLLRRATAPTTGNWTRRRIRGRSRSRCWG